MRRREFLKGSAALGVAAIAAPAVIAAERQRVLKFVPQTDVAGLDPVWTPTYPARDHSLMVFDTLFAQDDSYRAVPQMVDGVVTENDGLTWKLTLRPGLVFHDGSPVLARDCVASIQRWAKRDSFGGALMAATNELSAADDKTIVFSLKRPFPLLPDALGKSYPRICPMMPERLAKTDAFTQITEMVGSGPFKFVANERVAGARLVYERFDGYVPRPNGTAQWTSGPKVVHFDRVEWTIIPDPSTAFSALKSGEIDWWWTPDADLLPALRGDKSVNVRVADPTGQIGTLRFNHLIAPFNNAALRRAVLGAIDQRDFMTAIVGDDKTLWHDGVGYFCPGTPYASDAGMAALTGPRDLEKSKAAVKAAGYNGEKVVVLAPADIPNLKALADMTADMLTKIGFNVDYQAMGWGALVQRRFKEDPVEQGGWNIFSTFWSGMDQSTPAGHAFIRGNGKPTGPGWPTAPKIEALRDAWLAASDEATRKKIAADMQLQAFEDVPYAPLGQYFFATAHRADLTGMLNGLPAFWNVKRG
ncbi:ABC transporter substrate-binding protein [Chelatococcus asaccharovorans]|uniref:Peptide/nickel transport system substrate-binding protein n=1 Tax=Chelatococcus asaccharovorans TaxID=28210 RepID=A0A2V3U0T8_9HYPH|nr:ABC transporter substrate-binding protein [Chelatococcus asaccharovorans]MBS7707635.1 ABC transporter substrate-binding protein [Chelatococcus asaccharovorans]PXW55209.1 peptide/nickel transport system substrate-binding protein [Chelatococcus asaccharovorans]